MYTKIIIAANQQKIDIIRQYNKDLFEETVFLDAINGGVLNIVTSLIQAGVNVNSPTNKELKKPLEIAINQGNPEIVKVLIDNGADPNTIVNKNRTNTVNVGCETK